MNIDDLGRPAAAATASVLVLAPIERRQGHNRTTRNVPERAEELSVAADNLSIL